MSRSMAEELTMSKAINAGLRRALENDSRVLIMGEDVGVLGGVFRVTDGLLKDFGDNRIIDTPLGEAGIIGTAIGLAIRGYRPVCEIQFEGFIYPAYDQIVTQVAKIHYRTQGCIRLPIVIRIPYGGGIGAVEHHSESPEALFTHVAGIKVVTCATPVDAYWMIQQSIFSDDPIVFLEPKKRYWNKQDVITVGRLEDAYPLHLARMVRPGSDATIVAYGPMVSTAVECATVAETENRSLEVIDLRSLSPLNMGPIYESVRKTGKLIVVHEAPGNGGIGSEIAARVTEECFYSLQAPVMRVAGFNIPYPPSRIEGGYLPDLDRVLDCVDRLFGW